MYALKEAEAKKLAADQSQIAQKLLIVNRAIEEAAQTEELEDEDEGNCDENADENANELDNEGRDEQEEDEDDEDYD